MPKSEAKTQQENNISAIMQDETATRQSPKPPLNRVRIAAEGLRHANNPDFVNHPMVLADLPLQKERDFHKPSALKKGTSPPALLSP